MITQCPGVMKYRDSAPRGTDRSGRQEEPRAPSLVPQQAPGRGPRGGMGNALALGGASPACPIWEVRPKTKALHYVLL